MFVSELMTGRRYSKAVFASIVSPLVAVRITPFEIFLTIHMVFHEMSSVIGCLGLKRFYK